MVKENIKEPVPRDLSPTLFLGHLKEQMGSPYKTRETVRMIGNPEEIHNAKAQEDERDMDTVHITPPDDDYVAPATNLMSNKQLNKFEEEFSHITEVAEKEYDNPVIKTYDCETIIRKLLHQRMRMEQYIQMIGYSLWEVIENGSAPPITKVVKGIETTIAPTTAEEKAQR
ncbi:hypothetical protein Tco_0869074, partial [Tanacetum coccineum]